MTKTEWMVGLVLVAQARGGEARKLKSMLAERAAEVQFAGGRL
jgi:hypothetical protein